MNKTIEKWKKKTFWSKLSDIIFVLFIIAILLPAPRREIMKFVNHVKSLIIQPNAKENSSLKLNETDYNWQIISTEGKIINVASFKGKVIYINFWATWCGPCLGEMPEIQKFYDNFKKDTNVVFLALTNEDIETIKAFRNRNNYTFPMYSAPYGVPKILATNTIPTSFIIAKDGKVVVHTVGAANWGGKKTKKIIDKLVIQ